MVEAVDEVHVTSAIAWASMISGVPRADAHKDLRLGTTMIEPVLRPLSSSDAPDVLAAFLSDVQMNRQGDVTTLQEAQQYVDGLVNHPACLAWAIADGTHLVGLVEIDIDAENRLGWVSYWMHAEARGRGWTKRAAATVASWALDAGNLERLELGHRVNNPASGAVARAAGFIKEGCERQKFLIDGQRVDVDTYGRLRSDPVPQFEPVRMISDPADP
ncbi:MAG: GNAT family N-acetyltransferase [Propionibacteriaceae bacterium]|nr:GNAT family N-acetyltransferase [Propionibacteriaceae bacterium]